MDTDTPKQIDTSVVNPNAHPDDFQHLNTLDHNRPDAAATEFTPDKLTEYHQNKDPVRFAHALHNSVEYAKTGEVGNGIYASADAAPPKAGFLSHLTKLVPTKRFVRWHWGNYVVDREGKKTWENMPIYARIGMHLLFYGPAEEFVVESSPLGALFRRESLSSGAHFDSPDSAKNIPHFIKTYSIDTSELLEPDWQKYKTYNDFFSRKLKPGARTIDFPDNDKIIDSPADSRLSAFNDVASAKEYWVKGSQFTVANLIRDPEQAKVYEGGAIGIFRLAPQDYHRYHAPITGTVGKTVPINGTYFTVNPMAVNENLNVFTENKRQVTYLHQEGLTAPIAFVQIGALLVGSIKLTVKEGQSVTKGDDFGYFAYGGSTVILIFPKEANVKFDEDLIKNSKDKIETVVKVGNHIATREATSTA